MICRTVRIRCIVDKAARDRGFIDMSSERRNDAAVVPAPVPAPPGVVDRSRTDQPIDVISGLNPGSATCHGHLAWQNLCCQGCSRRANAAFHHQLIKNPLPRVRLVLRRFWCPASDVRFRHCKATTIM